MSMRDDAFRDRNIPPQSFGAPLRREWVRRASIVVTRCRKIAQVEVERHDSNRWFVESFEGYIIHSSSTRTFKTSLKQQLPQTLE